MEDSSDLLNNIFLGEVASVQNYGAFIRIPGNKNQGLVHRSQISSVAVNDASEVLQKGERVWCKVISMSDEGKIGLSMKVVDQGNGQDMDPNGVQIHQDEQRRKTMPAGGGRRKISLEAVFKTTCSKCGVTGHLAKDCFQGASGKVYELIPEDDPTDLQTNLITAVLKQDKKPKKEKKSKKEKKHKKEKKRKRKSSSSISEAESGCDSSDQKDHKKHKKRRRSRSRSPKKKKKHH